MITDIPFDWAATLSAETSSESFRGLARFVDNERAAHTVFPAETDVFNALKFSPYASTRVVILGQDPYHDEGQAHGLAFSVRPEVAPPRSLLNIFKELQADIGGARPATGSLTGWARQGVLLLNTVMTVRAHEANSHKGKGWELFTDGVIRAISARPEPVVFLLWGNPARSKAALIDTSRHRVIESAHPSPLSAARGFLGSRPFSQANQALRDAGEPAIDWLQTAG
ncbi:MAG: uracil-DNA glycosylase [Capsulimonadaceae bacterium]|nr:uracil-DNA glycosylase [Capsulimonadaceae bacterium]